MEVINGKARLGLRGALILKVVHRVCVCDFFDWGSLFACLLVCFVYACVTTSEN